MNLHWMILLLGGYALAQELPNATVEHGAFGLPDQSGMRLLAVSGMPSAAAVRTAICGGTRVSVSFERRQPALEDGTGRQTSGNFDRLPGDVFRVIGSQIPESACFLLSGDLSQAATLRMTAAGQNDACSAGIRTRVATAKGREVVHCFPLVRFEGEGQIVLAEFARKGREALASVAVVAPERTLFADYPAEFHGEGADLWRADDGGVLSPEAFGIVFVARDADQYLMALSWAGTEGLSLSLWVSSADSDLTRVIGEYWYRSPL